MATERERESDRSEEPEPLQAILRWLRFLNNVLLIPMFTLLVVETSYTRGVPPFFSEINHLFCLLFFSEWLLGLYLATDRKAYLSDPLNIADLISSIPFVVFVQGMRLVRLLRLLRIARVALRAHRFQGKGGRVVRVFGLVASLMLAGALAFRIVEPQTTDSLEHALWWSIVTLSTVGYGDVTPVTPAGRAIAAIVIFAGLGVFGYMAGFMTSLVEGDDERRELHGQLTRIEGQLAHLTGLLDDREASDERALTDDARDPDPPPHSTA